MDIVEIGPWVIQIESNQEENATKSLCTCLYCSNFYHAVALLDNEEVKILKKLRICPSKPDHLSYFGETEFKSHLYSGSYHLKATLLEGKPVRISEWSPLNLISIGKIKFVISDEVNFMPDGCDLSSLQLDFEWILPWILEEKPK